MPANSSTGSSWQFELQYFSSVWTVLWFLIIYPTNTTFLTRWTSSTSALLFKPAVCCIRERAATTGAAVITRMPIACYCAAKRDILGKHVSQTFKEPSKLLYSDNALLNIRVSAVADLGGIWSIHGYYLSTCRYILSNAPQALLATLLLKWN